MMDKDFTSSMIYVLQETAKITRQTCSIDVSTRQISLGSFKWSYEYCPLDEGLTSFFIFLAEAGIKFRMRDKEITEHVEQIKNEALAKKRQ